MRETGKITDFLRKSVMFQNLSENELRKIP